MHAFLDEGVLPIVTTGGDGVSVRAGAVGEKQGIAARGRADERELGVLRRPGGSGVAGSQERSRCPTGQRHENLLSRGIAVETEPDLRALVIEPEASQEVPGRHHRADVFREVLEVSGAELADPHVELSEAVGDEGHEPAVGRDLRLLFGAVPVRDPRERGVGERVRLRCRRAQGRPRDDSRGERDDRQPRRGGSRRSGRSCRHDGRRWRLVVDRVDLDPDVPDISHALLRILDQAAEQQPSNRRRCRGRQRRPVRLALEDLRDRVRHRVAGKRHPPGQHLVQHAAEGPDVGAFVDWQSARLFGTHVGGGADDRPSAHAIFHRRTSTGRMTDHRRRRSWRDRSREPSRLRQV